MFVSGPIGTSATGSGEAAIRRAIKATAPSLSAFRGATGSFVFPSPLSPCTSVARSSGPVRGPTAPSATGTLSAP